MVSIRALTRFLGFGFETSYKRLLLLSFIIGSIFFLTGISPNVFYWTKQADYVVNPHRMLDPESDLIQDLDERFNTFLLSYQATYPSFNISSQKSNFTVMENYVGQQIRYTHDLATSLSVNQFVDVDNTLLRGKDDCEGIAVVMCSWLIYRGYDAYVFISPVHAWVNVYDTNNDLVYNFFGKTDYFYVKFNNQATQFFPVELTIMLLFYTSVVWFLLFILNTVVVIYYYPIEDLYENTNQRIRESLRSIKYNPADYIKRKIQGFFKIIKQIIVGTLHGIRAAAIFLWQNKTRVTMSILYFVLSLMGAISVTWYVGQIIFINYYPNYVPGGENVRFDSLMLVSSFIISIIWLGLFLAGSSYLWKRLEKTKKVTRPRDNTSSSV